MDVSYRLAKFIKSSSSLVKVLEFIQTFNGNSRLENIYKESKLSKKEFIDVVEKICINFVDKNI